MLCCRLSKLSTASLARGQYTFIRTTNRENPPFLAAANGAGSCRWLAPRGAVDQGRGAVSTGVCIRKHEKMAGEVVDLTFSDSEDEGPAAKPKKATDASKQQQPLPRLSQGANKQDSEAPYEDQQRTSIMQFAQDRAKRLKLSPEVGTAADGLPPAAAGTSSFGTMAAAQDRDEVVLSAAPAANQLLAQLARERQARQQRQQEQEGPSTSGAAAAAGRLKVTIFRLLLQVVICIC